MDASNSLLKYFFDTPTNAIEYTKDKIKTTHTLDIKYAYYIKKDNNLVDIKTDDFKNKDNVSSIGDEFVHFKGDKKKYYTLYGIVRTIIMYDFKARWNKKDEETRVTDFKFFCSLLSQEFRNLMYDKIVWENESNNEKVKKRNIDMKEILYPKQMREQDEQIAAELKKAKKRYKEWFEFMSWHTNSENIWFHRTSKRKEKIKAMKKKIKIWGSDYEWLNDYLTYLEAVKYEFRQATEGDRGALNRYGDNEKKPEHSQWRKIKNRLENGSSSNTENDSPSLLQLKF